MRPAAPKSSSTTDDGSGTAVPLMVILSKRQLPELLFKAVPWVLTSSAPVDAFTISIAKFGLLAARGSLIVAVNPANQSCPAVEPLLSRLSLTYAPSTVLGEALFVNAVRPASDPPRVIGTLFQVTPSVVYSNWRLASPCVVEYQSKLTLIAL